MFKSAITSSVMSILLKFVMNGFLILPLLCKLTLLSDLELLLKKVITSTSPWELLLLMNKTGRILLVPMVPPLITKNSSLKVKRLVILETESSSSDLVLSRSVWSLLVMLTKLTIRVASSRLVRILLSELAWTNWAMNILPSLKLISNKTSLLLVESSKLRKVVKSKLPSVNLLLSTVSLWMTANWKLVSLSMVLL